jgi:hypothetical protein
VRQNDKVERKRREGKRKVVIKKGKQERRREAC